MYTVWTFLLYLAISVPVALFVGWTAHKNGRIFLVEVFHGNEELADSVNHLLIVGAYLISIGFITFSLQYGAAPDDAVGAIQAVSTKVGVVLFVLGGGHFLNILLLSRLRWRVRLVAPQGPENRARPMEPRELSTTVSGPGVDLESSPGAGLSPNPRTSE